MEQLQALPIVEVGIERRHGRIEHVARRRRRGQHELDPRVALAGVEREERAAP